MKKRFSAFLPYICIGLLSSFFLSCVKQKTSHFRLVDQDIRHKANDLFSYSADVLWVVDNSYSMQKYQQLLLSQMDSFLEDFSELKMNFRLGLTSMDMRQSEKTKRGGQLIGSPAILTPRITNWIPLFKERFLLGENGSNKEKGLDSIETLLKHTQDFVRPESPLVLIFLSDEEDESLKEASYYINFLNRLKPPHPRTKKKGWQANFFGILTKEDNGPNCDWSNTRRIRPGTRYLELVNFSNGTAVSLCSTYFRFQLALSKIKERLVRFFTDYKLDQQPIEETIEISINGEPISRSNQNGWIYHSDGNFIRFYGEAIPSYSDTLKIYFSPEKARF